MTRGGPVAEGGDAQVDGPDHRRADRHRAGAVGGVRADGVLRRLDRRHLPAVLDHHRLGDGAVGAGRPHPHAGAVRDAAEAGRARATTRRAKLVRLLRLVQPRVRARHRRATQRTVGGIIGRAAALHRRSTSLVVAVHGRAVRAPADRLPARRGPGHRCSRRCVLPAGATQERTLEVLEEGRAALPRRTRRTRSTAMFTVAGFSFGGSGQNMRHRPSSSSRTGTSASAPDMTRQGRSPARAHGRAVADPRRDGLRVRAAGGARARARPAGFDVQLQDRGGLGHDGADRRRATSSSAWRRRTSALVAVRPNGQEDTPQFTLDIDHAQGRRAGLSMADINDTLSTAWGGSYVNDFIDRGRVKKVYLQARRAVPHAAGGPRQVVRAQRARARWCRSRPSPRRTGPTARRGSSATTARRRSRSSARRAPGVSSGDAMAAVEELVGQAAAGHRLRVDRPVLPGAPRRRAGAGALRAVAAGRVPVPGRAVRELVDARSRCCWSCRSASSARVLAATGARPGERRLLPGRRC